MVSRVGHRQDADADADASAGSGRDRPSRLTDIAVALLLAVADALAVRGVGVLMGIFGYSVWEQPQDTSAMSRAISVSVAAAWVLPVALVVSAFVHARLRMPVTAVVQAVFTVVAALMALGETHLLLSHR